MRLILLVILSMIYGFSSAQVKDSSLSIFDYFIQHDVSEITLKTDMKLLQKNKNNEESQPAELSFIANDTSILNFEISVKARGNMRKKTCQFAPMKLNFSKKDLKSLGFEPVDKYKLVCQCAAGKSGEQLLLKEYLAYKLYNIITDNSFKVHLFTINYISPPCKKIKKRYGFLIESEKELAERLDGVELDTEDVNIEKVKRENIIEIGMFQYMIGNTDYSTLEMHNLIAIEKKKSDLAVLVAYDFDYSGLVDAKYAIPNPVLPTKDVKERWFNIKGCSRKEIETQFEHFREHKDEIINYCKEFKILNKKSYYSSLDYISEFFEIIDKPGARSDQFIRK